MLDHISENNSGFVEGDIISLTHPFYLHLSDMNSLASTHIEVAELYKYRLIQLFRLKKENPEINLCVFDTLYHYAAVTSLFHEQGLIDKVILTINDGGYPLLEEEPIATGTRNYYTGGCYNKIGEQSGCLNGTLSYLAENPDILPLKALWSIYGLSLNGIYHNNFFATDIRYNEGFSILHPDNTIAFNDLIQEYTNE